MKMKKTLLIIITILLIAVPVGCSGQNKETSKYEAPTAAKTTSAQTTAGAETTAAPETTQEPTTAPPETTAPLSVESYIKIYKEDTYYNNTRKSDFSYVMPLFAIDSADAEAINSALAGMVESAPFLFAVALFLMSIMLFSQAATVTTLYPVGIALGMNPMLLVAMFPAVNGYFFLPNYPTEVAALGFDRTGTTHVGKYVVNHSFHLPGWITTVVAIAVAYAITLVLY